MHSEIAEGQCFVHVQFAWTAVVPEAVGHVGVLLDFAEYDAGADGVYRVRGDHVRLARFNGGPMEQLFDFAGARGLAQLLSRDGLAETHSDRGSGLRVEYVPHLGLAERTILAIVGVDLHGEP